MSHPLPAFAPRRSTSQMLNYVVSILLILTLGAIAFLTLRTTPQIEEANELCQMTANAESKLWKISALSGRLLGSNPHDLTSEPRARATRRRVPPPQPRLREFACLSARTAG